MSDAIEEHDRILRDVRGSLTDAEVELSSAVRELEAGNRLEVESLLAEALAKLQILTGFIDRHLAGRAGGGHPKPKIDEGQ